jgi:tetratricopeptide (TPR) repeat protein
MLGSLLKSFKAAPQATPAGKQPSDPAAPDAVQAAQQAPPAPAAHAPGVQGSAGPGSVLQAVLAANESVIKAGDSGTLAQALAGAQAAFEQDPQDLVACLSLAGLQAAQGLPEALDSYTRAVALRPRSPILLRTLASMQQDQGRLEESIATRRLLCAAEPDNKEDRFWLSQALFMAGQYREAFLLFAAREHEPLLQRQPWTAHVPAWEGGSLAGRSILIWTDWGGLGDELLFSRYIGLVQRMYKPRAILVNCSAQNQRLFANIEGVSQALGQGGVMQADCHAALADLPAIFGTDFDSIPTPVPYLHPHAADQEKWRARLGPMRGLKIGLCWGSGFWNQGKDFDKIRQSRTLALELLRPMSEIPGVHLISLQKGKALEALEESGLPIANFDSELRDMADTAALASALDLVVSVDTSVPHLGGALALPTLMLMPAQSGTFWMTRQETAPWYPTVRLLRQPAPGDWAGPVARATALVRQFAATGRIDVFAPA